MQRFSVGAYMKMKKETRQKTVMARRDLHDKLSELDEIEGDIVKTEQNIKEKELKHSKLDKKVGLLVEEIEELDEIDRELTRVKGTTRMSEKSVKLRQKTPTLLKRGKLTISETVARQRRTETFRAAQEIHGGTEENKACAVGLIDTALKRCPMKVLEEAIKKFSSNSSYFLGNILFFPFHPTVWTLSHVVPAHTKEMKEKYGMGLGLNSMEGREAKHISISRYSQNSIANIRWEQILMHEYVSLIWLRERGYNRSKPLKSTTTYIPERVEEDNFCYCGCEVLSGHTECKYCLHPLRNHIKSCIKDRKYKDFK